MNLPEFGQAFGTLTHNTRHHESQSLDTDPPLRAPNEACSSIWNTHKRQTQGERELATSPLVNQQLLICMSSERAAVVARVDFQVRDSSLGFSCCPRSLMGCAIGETIGYICSFSSFRSLRGYGKHPVGRRRFCSISPVVLPQCSRNHHDVGRIRSSHIHHREY